MNELFNRLEDLLYKKLEPVIGKCKRPCWLSIFPPAEPHELRKEREMPENAKGLKKGKKAA